MLFQLGPSVSILNAEPAMTPPYDRDIEALFKVNNALKKQIVTLKASIGQLQINDSLNDDCHLHCVFSKSHSCWSKVPSW